MVMSRFLNEVLVSLFLIRCEEGIVIHKKNKTLIWNKFNWEIDNNVLFFTNEDTKEEYIVNNLNNYKVKDDDYYVEFTKDLWIEMM